MRLRINEAVAQSTARGKKVLKSEIAARLFANSNPQTQRINMSNLCSGITKRVSIEWIGIICEMLDCSADFLFGIEDNTQINK